MANPAGDFTAGGQLFEAYWHMFLSSLKPIMWVGLGAALLMWIYLFYTVVDDGDWYYLGMWTMGHFWDAINANPDKLFNVRTGGYITQVRAVNLTHYPPIADAMGRWWHILTTTFGTFLMAGGIAAMVYIPLAERIGKNTRKRSKERGAFITDPLNLKEMIDDDNAPKRKAERDSVKAEIARLEEAGESTEHLQRTLQYEPYTLAGIPYPWRLETTHTMLMGTTGTGKSTALKDLLWQARARNDRAVIFDLTGSFVETYYDPERDIILNALDTRCPHWSLFHDCKNKLHLRSAAQALIPHDGGSSEAFWTEAARMMLVEACWKLMQSGRASNEALYDEIMVSVLPNLSSLLAGTVAGPISDPEARRMAESVRATLNANAFAIELLPTTGPYFSIRDWVQNDDGKGGFLFISASSTHLQTLRSMLTLWYDTAIYSLMEMPTAQRDLKMWFHFDELAALHRLPSLENGMRTARNFGGAFVLGVHTIQQIWHIYGRELGDTIASLGRTKLYLAQPDVASAEWCSDNIGKTEWSEFKKTTTVGVERIRDGIGYSQDTEYKAIALPDQIMNLPSLTGYIKMPEGYPAALIGLQFVSYPKLHPGFVEREIFQRPQPSVDAPQGSSSAAGLEDRVEPDPAPQATGDIASAPVAAPAGAGRVFNFGPSHPLHQVTGLDLSTGLTINASGDRQIDTGVVVSAASDSSAMRDNPDANINQQDTANLTTSINRTARSDAGEKATADAKQRADAQRQRTERRESEIVKDVHAAERADRADRSGDFEMGLGD